jgi:hypothetical protein
MASLIDRITGIFRKAQPPAERTTAAETVAPQRPMELMERFKAERGRAEIVRKCREMYDTDPRAEKMHQKLARDIVKGGFIVRCEDEQALQIAEDLRKRLKLNKRLDDWVRLTARDGDSFLEVSINERMEIVDITRKPTLEMHRNSDKSDRFTDPARAFWWSGDGWQAAEPGPDAVWFAEWQIVHARWQHDEGSRYGKPMMASGVGHWKKVTEGELDIAVRRKTQAGMKTVHKFPEGTTPADIEAYKEINKSALDNPFAAAADYFGTVDIYNIQGDATLSEISDVRHMIATWLAGADVPMELIAYGEDLNRDVLSEKKAEYDETLSQLQEWAAADLVQPILELQWLLKGIYPAALDYSIEWRRKKDLAAADLASLADAAIRLQTLGVKPETVAQLIASYIPDLDPEDLLPDEDTAAADAGRLADIIRRLGGSANDRGDGDAEDSEGNDDGDADRS